MKEGKVDKKNMETSSTRRRNLKMEEGEKKMKSRTQAENESKASKKTNEHNKETKTNKRKIAPSTKTYLLRYGGSASEATPEETKTEPPHPHKKREIAKEDSETQTQ